MMQSTIHRKGIISMQGEFIIYPQELKRAAEEYQTMCRLLRYAADRISDIEKELEPSSYPDIKGTLCALHDSIVCQTAALQQFETILCGCAAAYTGTEERLHTAFLSDPETKNAAVFLKNMLFPAARFLSEVSDSDLSDQFLTEGFQKKDETLTNAFTADIPFTADKMSIAGSFGESSADNSGISDSFWDSSDNSGSPSGSLDGSGNSSDGSGSSSGGSGSNGSSGGSGASSGGSGSSDGGSGSSSGASGSSDGSSGSGGSSGSDGSSASDLSSGSDDSSNLAASAGTERFGKTSSAASRAGVSPVFGAGSSTEHYKAYTTGTPAADRTVSGISSAGTAEAKDASPASALFSQHTGSSILAAAALGTAGVAGVGLAHKAKTKKK